MKLLEYTKQRGTQTKLAEAIGVTVTQINHWSHGVRQVPSDRCIDIEKATHGVVRCEELRPDIDWSYIRKTRKAS